MNNNSIIYRNSNEGIWRTQLHDDRRTSFGTNNSTSRKLKMARMTSLHFGARRSKFTILPHIFHCYKVDKYVSSANHLLVTKCHIQFLYRHTQFVGSNQREAVEVGTSIVNLKLNAS